jgi:hypothetical protein
MIGEHRSGRLTAMGTLFLSAPVYQQMTSGGSQQYVLPMVQRDGMGVMSVVGIWLGPAADSFMSMHRGALKPGKALDVTFERVFVHRNELHGIILSCVLAPDRWPARVQPREATTV